MYLGSFVLRAERPGRIHCHEWADLEFSALQGSVAKTSNLESFRHLFSTFLHTRTPFQTIINTRAHLPSHINTNSDRLQVAPTHQISSPHMSFCGVASFQAMNVF